MGIDRAPLRIDFKVNKLFTPNDTGYMAATHIIELDIISTWGLEKHA